jgi:hypothetical protein
LTPADVLTGATTGGLTNLVELDAVVRSGQYSGGVAAVAGHNAAAGAFGMSPVTNKGA